MTPEFQLREWRNVWKLKEGNENESITVLVRGDSRKLVGMCK